MVRLREIPRTGAFAWSPGSGSPLVVTGTRAGAVDADFSDETKLELWDLSLDNLEQGVELQPIATISTDSRFHDIAWSPADENHPRGVIAGGLENGSLHLWDAEKLINGSGDALMSKTTNHTGAIKSVQFSPKEPQELATAGEKGELFVYNINNMDEPIASLVASARDNLECVSWNRIRKYILATGGSSGYVTVWNLNSKKATLTITNSKRKAVGAIEWDPNNETKLVTATSDDSAPDILLWNLRNREAPERALKGHTQGVLSLSWCQQDPDLLLSCGMDNRTLIWNPQTGESLGEFPEVTNWTFETRFNPHNPSLSATASIDGIISIQTLQNTNPTASQAPSDSVDGEDFFTKAQTQPQGASFSLKKAPKWLERPVGASFAFGGKVVSFALNPQVEGQPRTSKVQVSLFSVDSDVGTATESFEKALNSGDISSICESHIADAKTDEEKADWQVLETLLAENPRKRVTEYLGFSEVEEATNGLSGLDLQETEKGEESSSVNGQSAAAKKNSRASALFDGDEDGDDFLSTLAATKGVKNDSPFHLFSATDPAFEKQITKALLVGQFEKAVNICLKEDRIADALIIAANCGGKELLDKAQSAYLSRKTEGPNYLRLLTSVIGKNLWDIVHNADLSNWKEIMAALCTYADPTEFPDLSEALGDRILEDGSSKDASFCYLVGSKLEKVIKIWMSELEEAEKAGIENMSGDSSFSVHARSLQNFIEKVTIFRVVVKFQDTEQSLSSGWKLTALYDKYTEYADVVAAHGHLSIAERYLNLLPTQYPAAEVARNRVKLATRKATQKPAQVQPSSRAQSRAQPVGYQPPASTNYPQPASSGYQPPASTGYQPPAAASFQPPASIAPRQASSFVPQGPTPASNPYAPPTNQFVNQQPTPQPGYQQSSYQQPQQQGGYGGAQGGYGGYAPYGGSNTGGYGPPAQSFAPPPPRNSGPSAPPPKAKDVGQWNDTPMVTDMKPARRTPQPPPTAAGFQHNLSMPPPASSFGGPRATPTPPPPPPKGPAPARMMSPLGGGPNQFQQPPRPSSAANAYSPQAASPVQSFAAPTIPRGASPYNAAPTGAPPMNSGRYAPSPAAQQYSQPPSAPSQIAPPPQGASIPPPSNPYAPAPQNQYAQQQAQYGASQPPPQSFQSQGPPMGGPPQGPPQGPPMGSRPPTGPPPRASAAPPPPPPAAKPKHPAGDRSHIPQSAQRMVDVLKNDFQRVKAAAPASFAPQVKDTEKRLDILFDLLNNEETVKLDTIQKLGQLAEALQSRDYDQAAKLQVEIQKEKTDECGNWMVGVKRLINMSKLT